MWKVGVNALNKRSRQINGENFQANKLVAKCYRQLPQELLADLELSVKQVLYNCRHGRSL
jgi:hypothetical protein